MEHKIFDFIRDEVKDLRSELKQVNDKVDKLLAFKYQIVGGSVLASLILTVIIRLIEIAYNKP